MTTNETNTYNDYVAKLDLVRIMMADHRTNAEIMKAMAKTYPKISLTTEKEYLDWVNMMGDAVQSYLKKYAAELKAKGNTVAQIALTIGRSEKYVNLLLNATQQGAFDGSGTDTSALREETLKQRALSLAEAGKTVAQIATELGVTNSAVKNTYLGAAVLKRLAKKMADDNKAVSTIASTLDQTQAWVCGSNGLGSAYMDKWAWRLANDDLSVASIVTKLGNGKQAKDIQAMIKRVDPDYFSKWALRLVDQDVSVSNIAIKLGYTEADIRNTYIGLENLKAWIRRLATYGGKTVQNISGMTGRSSNDIRSLFLGVDYMKNWVVQLNAAKKTIDQIVTITGLEPSKIQEYIKENAAKTGKKSVVESIVKSASNNISGSSASLNKRNRVTKLVNDGKTMTQICNDATIKTYYSNKVPTAATIQKEMGNDFMKSWAIQLANNNIEVSTIAANLGYSGTTATSTIRNFLGSDYLTEWAKRLINNNVNATVANIATKLAETADDKEKAVRNRLGTDFLSAWAKRLANNNVVVPTIAEKMGITSKSVRENYLGEAALLDWIKRRIATVSSKTTAAEKRYTCEYLRTKVFDVPSDKNWIHNRLVDKSGNPITAYKNWAANLKNKGYYVSEIADYIGQSESYVRDKLLGEAIMKAWVISIVRAGGNTAATIKTETGYNAVTAESMMGKVEFKSWAIRWTNSSKNWSTSDILERIGTIYSTGSKSWISITSSNKSTANNNKFFREFLGWVYVAKWVKRLASAGLSDGQICLKIYASTDSESLAKVKKYKSSDV